MPVLPHDVIAEILTGLPVKSLLRFKCVCKQWDSLISNPQFVKMHLNRAVKDVNNNRQRCLISPKPLQYVYFEVDDDAAVMVGFRLRMDPKHRIGFMGSANGLVCLVLDVYNLILWNPSTRDAKELPKPKLMPKFPKLRDGLDFVFGLGYDSSIDDYKVVRLIHFTHSHRFIRTRGDVFTLKTNAWRRIDEIHPSAFMFKKTGTFSNGSLHWLVDRGNGEDKFKSIVSFDLATAKCQEVVPLPDHDVETCSIEGFRDLGGFFVMIFGYADYFEVWVMKEYGVKTSWTKLVTYPWEEAPPHMDWFSPLCFSKSDEVLMDVDGSELVMYRLKVNTFMKLLIYGESWERFDSVIYAESLVSLNGNDGTDKQRRGQRKRRKRN